MNPLLLLLPLLSAAGGFFIVWLLSKCIFYPVQPITILGIRFQGAIPKKLPDIAAACGAFVKKEFDASQLTRQISKPENFQKILPQVEEHIDNFLKVKLPASMPMIGMLIGDRTISQLKSIFIAELESLFPVVMTGYMQSVQTDLDIEKMVREKITAIGPVAIAQTLSATIGQPLRKALALGALLGFILGCLEWGIIHILQIHNM